ncbi:16S rRNA (uracil(1498)-N(3))-methyltransferase [Alteribacter aurantiacus]|uniref:16S rRNA (uracil(1498)-N(3))-methyltransferase n=1 Tax=Alteribacter aurantiacus TaxID=254410 RepID=UPI0003FFC02B|nr:16S rRNA (uracil(1498)-N(3))-methyltransferase [Alteribacter aurantiacus]
MQRYFLEDTQFDDNYVIIAGDDAKHIQKVMRMNEGDNVICCNQSGDCFLSAIEEMTLTEVRASIQQIEERSSEMPVHVTIACGLTKADKLEWVIQKGTEMGAFSYIPFEADRSVVKLDPKKAVKKQDRWNKIAKEAAEQSHRQRIPFVYKPESFKQLTSRIEAFDHVLVAYEEEARNDEKSRLVDTLAKVEEKDTILLIVGPEGGFSDREIEGFIQAGAHPCALGPRILRAETAPLYALSAISYHIELLR